MKKKIFVSIAVAALLVFTLINGISFIAAHKAINLPKQAILKSPIDYGLDYENISFKSTDDIPINGWWIPGDSSAASGNSAVIFVIHGYGANRAGWMGRNLSGEEEYIDWLAMAPSLNKAGFNLVYFDLRACGESGGDKITFGRNEAYDLMGAVNWVLENKKTSDGQKFKKIGFVGMSMGGNVSLRGAIELKKLPIEKAAVISIGAYRFDTMIEKSIKFWTALPEFFIPFVKLMARLQLGFDPCVEIDPVKYVGDISPIPILFIQAEMDEIGDVEDAIAIYENAEEPKELVIIPDALRFEAYKYPAKNPEKIIEFFSEHLQ